MHALAVALNKIEVMGAWPVGSNAGNSVSASRKPSLPETQTQKFFLSPTYSASAYTTSCQKRCHISFDIAPIPLLFTWELNSILHGAVKIAFAVSQSSTL